MATRALRDFLPLVMPYARACPHPAAIQAIRLAAIEWCERTRCWRVVTQVAVTEQNEAIVAPDYATIHEIERAEFEGVPLTPTQYSEFTGDQLAALDAGPPSYITQKAPGTVALIPFATGTLDLTLFLKPRSGPEFGSNGTGGTLTEDQNVLPEHVFQQDAEAIASGALHRILTMPEVPWANPQLAAHHFGQFTEKADRKFRSHITGQQRARKRSRASWF